MLRCRRVAASSWVSFALIATVTALGSRAFSSCFPRLLGSDVLISDSSASRPAMISAVTSYGAAAQAEVLTGVFREHHVGVGRAGVGGREVHTGAGQLAPECLVEPGTPAHTASAAGARG